MGRKRKLDPKIIRVEDKVKIINPVRFVRCGYPLCLKDMKVEIDKHFKKVIGDLVHSVCNGDEFIQADEEGKYDDGTWLRLGTIGASDGGVANDDIVEALARRRIVSKGFGGTARSIHTEPYEQIKDEVAVVTRIKYVKTGTYNKGYGGYDYYSGCYEYDPPYLSDEKTHKILELDLFLGEGKKSDGKLRALNSEPVWIEAVNVEKIMENEDS